MSKKHEIDPNDIIEGQVMPRAGFGELRHVQAQAAAKPAQQAVSGVTVAAPKAPDGRVHIGTGDDAPSHDQLS